MSTCMNPEVFGPHFWATIHLSALHSSDKEQYSRFIESLAPIIPCKQCSEHFQENIIKHPIHDDLFKWSVEIHNIVNKQTHKPEILYNDAYVYWCSYEPKRTNVLVVLLMILGILSFLCVLASY